MSDYISLRRRILLLFLYGWGTAFYLLFGGTVMWKLERSGEVSNLEYQAQQLEMFEKKYGLSRNDTTFLEEIGVCSFPDHQDPHWSYTGSVFFALTVITTIGYGETAPRTWGGQLFCFFYSIPGISIAGLWLQNMAGLLAEIISGIVQRIDHKIRQPPLIIPNASDCATAYDRYRDPGTDCVSEKGLQLFLQDMTRQRCQPRVMSHVLRCVDTDRKGMLNKEQAMTAISIWYQVNAELPQDNKTTVKYALACLISTLTWMAMFSLFFSLLEGWTYAASLWFCFVTLSTIGFGDYIPARKDSRTLCFFFICGGLGMMGALLGVQTDLFIERRFWALHWLHQRGFVSAKLMQAHGISVVAPLEEPEKESDGKESDGKEEVDAVEEDPSEVERSVREPVVEPPVVQYPEPVAILPLPVVRKRPPALARALRQGKPPPPRGAPPLPLDEDGQAQVAADIEQRLRRAKPPPPLLPPPPEFPFSDGEGGRSASASLQLQLDRSAAAAGDTQLLARLSELERWRAVEEERRQARLRLDAALVERRAVRAATRSNPGSPQRSDIAHVDAVLTDADPDGPRPPSRYSPNPSY
eukprot:Hpha_TRINITY_DN30034_c0_g1::TRINITY_DN30034_c0_g1_i1::g.21635::m.21635